ncbi:DUF805 domain-containing protein [Phenylobacterium sp.]|uniref:DUF805 domain-containing protein n=1 Tax=Phenylobacterium sp. TaxID=1871053 RepID=UPI0025FCFB96|nr:DUF805 domain-containing protein [Phenylobacterium sp.]
MTDPHDTVGAAKPRGVFWWLGRRAGRGEYWVWVAIIFVLSIGLSYIDPDVGVAMTAPLTFAQIRRAHDFGRSGWWAAAATVAPVVATLPVLSMGLVTATLVGVAAELALIVLFGALPGDAGDNRFGPPRPFTWPVALTGR